MMQSAPVCMITCIWREKGKKHGKVMQELVETCEKHLITHSIQYSKHYTNSLGQVLRTIFFNSGAGCFVVVFFCILFTIWSTGTTPHSPPHTSTSHLFPIRQQLPTPVGKSKHVLPLRHMKPASSSFCCVQSSVRNTWRNMLSALFWIHRQPWLVSLSLTKDKEDAILLTQTAGAILHPSFTATGSSGIVGIWTHGLAFWVCAVPPRVPVSNPKPLMPH